MDRTDPNALQAVERAREAVERADVASQEMHERTGRIRREREANHFAPLIIELMKRKP